MEIEENGWTDANYGLLNGDFELLLFKLSLKFLINGKRKSLGGTMSIAHTQHCAEWGQRWPDLRVKLWNCNRIKMYNGCVLKCRTFRISRAFAITISFIPINRFTDRCSFHVYLIFIYRCFLAHHQLRYYYYYYFLLT